MAGTYITHTAHLCFVSTPKDALEVMTHYVMPRDYVKYRSKGFPCVSAMQCLHPLLPRAKGALLVFAKHMCI